MNNGSNDGSGNNEPKEAPAGSPAAVNANGTPIAKPATADSSPNGGWPGAFAAFSQAFDQIKKNPEPAYVVIAAYVVIGVVSTMAQSGEPLTPDSGVSTAGLLSSPEIGLTLAVGLLFLLALPTYALAIADRKSISIAEFMRFDAAKYFYVLGASILAFLAIALSALLFIIPIIWTMAWFYFSPYNATDKANSPLAAMSESKRLAGGHKAKVWGMIGACIVFAIAAGVLNSIPFIGGIFTGAMTVLIAGASGILYRWLQAQQPTT